MPKENTKVLRFPELRQLLGVSRSTVFRWERDKQFPQHIQLGTMSVGWLSTEVEDWLAKRAGAR
ncbi:MAG: AlpA family transcriptional regulator [Gammaproteobacteria bacterium]